MIIAFYFFIIIIFIYFSLRHSWWARNIPFDVPRIITYHMIKEQMPKKMSKFNRLRVKPKDFQKQIKWLKNNGYTSFTLSELVENKDKLPEKSIAITIDDGYEDNYTNAYQILKKYNFKATIFIVNNRFNNSWATDKDKKQSSDELNQEKMLSNAQIKEMLSSKLIEIGSHTLNHLDLTSLENDEKIKEISHSKQEIEEAFNIICKSFVYPFGYYDEKSIEIIKQNGFVTAASGLESGYEKINETNRWKLKRVLISGRQSFFDFKLKIKKGRNR